MNMTTISQARLHSGVEDFLYFEQFCSHDMQNISFITNISFIIFTESSICCFKNMNV